MSESTATAAESPPPQSGPRRSLGVEAAIVFGLTVGVWLARTLLEGAAEQARRAFTNQHLYGLVVYEVALAAILVPWLLRRGWKPAETAGSPAPVDVARGAGLWLLAVACYALTWNVFAAVRPDLAKLLATTEQFGGVPATALAGVLASVVNPVFEEFLWLGYGVARLGPRIGVRAASMLSLVLRVAVHAYQGPWALLGVLPLSLAFTWYYGRTRRLWPVVVAHVLFDAIGLAQRMAAG
jgi:membrane protease YdiL (CAAX protease family)